MGKIVYSTAAKICAVILLCISSCMTAILCMGIYAASNGIAYAQQYWQYYGMDLQYTIIDFAIEASPVLTIFCILITLALLIYLAYTAGHKSDKEGITLNALDKCPLDIMVGICIGAGVLILLVLGASMYAPVGTGLSLGIPLWFCLVLLGTELLVSFSARVKAGKWWENTVIYRFIMKPLAKLFKAILRIFANISVLWKLMLLFFIFAAAILFAIMSWGNYYNETVVIILISIAIMGLFILVCLIGIQAHILFETAAHMASGDLDYRADTEHMFSAMKKHGEHLNSISDGLSLAVEARIKSEHFKTELITNVSHDLKTPLTSIINYVDLMNKENIDNENIRKYLEVLSRQSAKLKKLTEDLIDASKASTGNIKMELSATDVKEFVGQIEAEYADKLRQSNLELITDMPQEDITIMADGRYLWRVFDNLFNNICKYAMPDTRVFVEIIASADKVCIALKNTSRELLNVPAAQLTDRFVRGDSARSSEGSGLGLSIAESLTTLQNGTMELFTDGDLFKAVLCFSRVYV